MNITEQQVSEWMQEQLAKAHEMSEYGHVAVSINQMKGHAAIPEFSVYLGRDRSSGNMKSIGECFEAVKAITPESIAKTKREQAEKLIAEAIAIESENPTTLQD